MKDAPINIYLNSSQYILYNFIALNLSYVKKSNMVSFYMPDMSYVSTDIRALLCMYFFTNLMRWKMDSIPEFYGIINIIQNTFIW